MKIDAAGLHYRELNERIHAAMETGEKEIELDNVRGQRYIGAGLNSGLRITINGVPGNDMGAFMNGADIRVRGNGQDCIGNTMNAGSIIIDGDAGDVLGHSMRGGSILVRGNVGYRAGIHMKAYGDRFPVVVIGGRAHDYPGEYMAGGMLVVLGLESGEGPLVGELAGTGMHGGAIYVRGATDAHELGREVRVSHLESDDWAALGSVLAEFCREFDLPPATLQQSDFSKLTPLSTRPYGRLYAY